MQLPKYNNAMVAVESNGVGVAVLALLQEMECKASSTRRRISQE